MRQITHQLPISCPSATNSTMFLCNSTTIFMAVLCGSFVPRYRSLTVSLSRDPPWYMGMFLCTQYSYLQHPTYNIHHKEIVHVQIPCCPSTASTAWIHTIWGKSEAILVLVLWHEQQDELSWQVHVEGSVQLHLFVPTHHKETYVIFLCWNLRSYFLLFIATQYHKKIPIPMRDSVANGFLLRFQLVS